MWDTYLAEGSSEGFSEFHVYVCAAFLVKWSEQLQKQDFQVSFAESWHCVPFLNLLKLNLKHNFFLGYYDFPPAIAYAGLEREGCRITLVRSLYVENIVS